jgi:hypothetical protein
VYIAQSDDGRLAIVCFRGTELTSIINWLTGASAKMEPFDPEGSVHHGFHHSFLALWDRVRDVLCDIRLGVPIDKVIEPSEGGARRAPRRVGEVLEPLKALYITGHSLGGALAALCAAKLSTDPDAEDIEPLLRSVYTFGQPMVGDGVLAKSLGEKFGDKLFRHVYGRDIIPHFLPHSAGPFQHFGREYSSTDMGWVPATDQVGQARYLLPTLAVAVLDWLRQQGVIPDWPRLPGWLTPDWFLSLDDHSPLHYVQASQIASVDAVFSRR